MIRGARVLRSAFLGFARPTPALFVTRKHFCSAASGGIGKVDGGAVEHVAEDSIPRDLPPEEVLKNVDELLGKARSEYEEGNLSGCVTTNMKIINLMLTYPQIAEGQWQKLAASNMNNAFALKLLGDYESAKAHAEIGLKMLDKRYSDHKAQVSNALDLLGELCEGLGDVEAAHLYIQRSIEIKATIFGKDDVRLAYSLNVLGGLYLQQKEHGAARTNFMRALAIQVRASGGPSVRPVHPQVAVTMSNLAGVLRDEDRLPECLEIYREAVRAFEKLEGDKNGGWMLGQALTDEGATLVRLGRHSDGKKALEKAVIHLAQSRGIEHPSMRNCLDWLKAAKAGEDTGAEPEETGLVGTLLAEVASKVEAAEKDVVGGQIIFLDRRGHIGHSHPHSPLI